MNRCIYLDSAATTPLCKEAAEALLNPPHLHSEFYSYANANSLHSEGRRAFSALEQARGDLAHILGIRPHELIMTSGATEADNLVLFGSIFAYMQRNSKELPHIITTQIEHDAIYKTAKKLETLSRAHISFVEPDANGFIDPSRIASLIRAETILVSVIAVHNEFGTVQDLNAIGSVCHEAGVLFHTDAVQALGKLNLDLGALPVDFASFSAHKIGGPKGVGMLYRAAQIPLVPYLYGGGQEAGMRSGTQNVEGVCAFAAAAKKYCTCNEQFASSKARMRDLRDILYRALTQLPGVVPSVNCPKGSTDFAPHIVNVCVDGIESETLILQLDLAGFAVSGGSACSSHSLEASRSLLALGLPKDVCLGSLRISLLEDTTEEDIVDFIETFTSILEKFR